MTSFQKKGDVNELYGQQLRNAANKLISQRRENLQKTTWKFDHE